MTHLRRNPIPYLALLIVLAIGVGGGYALAASNTKTITVCADKSTGVLHLKTRGRCKSSQTRVSWNQQGPPGPQGGQGPTGSQGPAGAAGPTGAQGRAAVSVWAHVADDGTVLAGQGIAVHHVPSSGTYQVTIIDGICAHENNAPVISVSDSNPPAGHGAGTFPIAWYGATGANEQFTVVTGVVSGIPPSFSASDHTFDIIDTCQ
jgi:hypothetical protein